jgi:acetyl esterase/lipase
VTWPRSLVRLAAILPIGVAVSVASCTATPEAPTEPRSGLIGEDVTYAPGRTLDVYRPTQGGSPLPVVITVHGCCGDRSDLTKLAEGIAAAGAVVLNTDWAGIRDGASYPGAWEDIACAVRFARARASAYAGDASRVALLGWSDGALAAATVALAGDQLDSSRCAAPGYSAHPDSVVAVGGFFGWALPVDPTFVNDRTTRFFGGTPAQATENWRDASPYHWLSRCRGMPFRLLVAKTDPLRKDAQAFALALGHAGHRVRVFVLPPGGDQSLISPRSAEGLRVIAETIAAATEIQAYSGCRSSSGTPTRKFWPRRL